MGDGQAHETAIQKMTATAAGVVAGVALLAAIIGISSTSSSALAKLASSSPEEVSKSAPVVKPQVQVQALPKPQAAKVIPTTHAPPPVVQAKSRIVIQAKQGSWIDACADGRTVIRRYLAPSNTADLGFSNAAVVRTGNAGGVEVAVNGTSTGPVGALGEVRVIRFDAAGFHFLEQGDPGTECGQ